MAIKHLSLFKRLDDILSDRIGLKVEEPKLSYLNSEQEEVDIEIKETGLNNFKLNELDSTWSPEVNNLYIEQNFIIKCPDKLFGEEGITSSKNILGLGVHYYSKTSNFQTTKSLGEIRNTDSELVIMFKENFSVSSISGLIFFEFFIYLKTIKESLPFQADLIGMNLSDEPIDTYSILIDGDGSIFPIEEIDEKNEPLWKLVMNWTDVEVDLFDYSNIRLLLNKAHPLFKSLFKENYKVNNYLMNEIMISAMSMIVQKVILIDRENITIDMDATQGSIAQVVWYWISTFELNLNSLEEINESFHKNVDPFIEGGIDNA